MKTISEEAAFTLQFINQTQKSVFLTGKAGTGKTTLLKEIIQTTHKNTVVVAPTGIAALNAGGVTIHSLFQLPFGGFIPVNGAAQFTQNGKIETKNTLLKNSRMNGTKKAVIRNMELLVIDEVSMLRADLLDAIDYTLQVIRKKYMPFGGVQVLFIGDLLQLPPVVKEDEWQILRQYYNGKFFFNAHAVQQNLPLYIELPKIFRQNDTNFISILNNLRQNQMSENDIKVLNRFVKPNFDFKQNKGYITLTTHNHKADNINTNALRELNGEITTFYPEIIGDFPEKLFPFESNLELKEGAQVMFVKNDSSFEKNYFNGKMGVVKSLSSNEITVFFAEENKTILLDKYEWKNVNYNVNENTKEIEEEVLGTYVQYPIKLAWAITIHKSQGLTFEKAALDMSQIFMPGQAYVALSRLTSLNGLVLLSPLQMNGISNDQEVMFYAQQKASPQFLKKSLNNETKKFICNYLLNSFEWVDLQKEWEKIQWNSTAETDKLLSSERTSWAKKHIDSLRELIIPARKFQTQLQQLFTPENIDWNFVLNRIKAAFEYFLPPMNKLVTTIIWELEETKSKKRSKTFYTELLILEELQVKAVLQLMKAQLLIDAVAKGKILSKETLTSNEIKSYLTNKKAEVYEDFKKTKGILEINTPNKNEKNTKKTNSKKPSTIEETHKLWVEKKTVEEIAQIRKFSVSTIYGHLEKLIQSEQVKLEEFFSSEKIEELTVLFKNNQEQTLSQIKEKCNDQFSWEELRLYRSSLQIIANKV